MRRPAAATGRGAFTLAPDAEGLRPKISLLAAGFAQDPLGATA